MPAKIRREPAECTNKCRSKEDAARLITVATDEGTEESVVLHRDGIKIKVFSPTANTDSHKASKVVTDVSHSSQSF